MSTEPITGLTYQEAGSRQTDVLQNAELNYVSAWLNCAVLSVGDTAPPGSPAEGDRYIVGASATGAWATHDDALAVYRGGWQFYAPSEGVAVKDLDSGDDYEFIAAAWTVKSGGGGGSSTIAVATPSNASGTVTLDFAGLSKYVGAIVLGANVTTLVFDNLPGAGMYAEYELHITQDGTGAHTFAIPASHKALGGSDTAIASAANATTVLTASTFDAGTTWRYAMQESA